MFGDHCSSPAARNAERLRRRVLPHGWPAIAADSMIWIMLTRSYDTRRQLESLDRSELESHQLAQLNRLLRAILPHNGFYAEKLAGSAAGHLDSPDGPLTSFDQIAHLPFTHKEELISPRRPGDLAGNLTFPRSATRGFIRPRARMAARWWCSTRRTIGSGGWTAGNSCSTRPKSIRAIACSWRFRSARSSVFGARSTRPASAAAWRCRGAA